MTTKRPLTLQELEDFFINQDSPRFVHETKYRALMGVLYLLGCRVGELLANKPRIKQDGRTIAYGPKLHGLRWKDIGLDSGELGYITFRIRTEKAPKEYSYEKPLYREVIVPIRWGVAPPGIAPGRFDRMVAIEKACLSALDEWSEIQSKFKLNKPNDPVFPGHFDFLCAEVSKKMGKDDEGVSLTSHYFRHTRTSFDDERGLSVAENAAQRGHAKLETTSIYLHPNKQNIIRKLIGG